MRADCGFHADKRLSYSLRKTFGPAYDDMAGRTSADLGLEDAEEGVIVDEE